MKNAFNYLLVLILFSCNPTHKDKNGTNINEHYKKKESQITNSVSNYNTDFETHLNYNLSENSGDDISTFKGYCVLKTKPTTEINLGLHFEKDGNQVQDSINTHSFSKFMDLNNVNKIQIDSLEYKVVDNVIKLKFTILLSKEENDKLKVCDKYFMVYSSGFKNPKPTMIVDKIEKKSIEIIGNTF